MQYFKNKYARVKRSDMDCHGFFTAGQVVEILSAKERMAEVTDGYRTSILPAKELMPIEGIYK